ncbi:MAG: hypothetical protein J6L71_03755, partial [Clostridia bacterium]|nr:hypothetical protein [Clostridia bacterium]
MNKSLYFKIVLILLIFIIAVMCAVAAILMDGVTSFYVRDFNSQMEECFEDGGLLMKELSAVDTEQGAAQIKGILSAYGSILGIDQYRNYYVLDMNGEMLTGSDTELGEKLTVTPNILSQISGSGENIVSGNTDFSDWAIRLSVGEDDVIIYIKDSLEEMRQLNRVIFSIIFQAMVIGVLIAVILSFFLARSISSPLQRLTYGTQLI